MSFQVTNYYKTPDCKPADVASLKAGQGLVKLTSAVAGAVKARAEAFGHGGIAPSIVYMAEPIEGREAHTGVTQWALVSNTDLNTWVGKVAMPDEIIEGPADPRSSNAKTVGQMEGDGEGMDRWKMQQSLRRDRD